VKQQIVVRKHAVFLQLYSCDLAACCPALSSWVVSMFSVCSTELVVQFLLKDDTQMLRLMCDLTRVLCDQIM
jgi:hypothetical protein